MLRLGDALKETMAAGPDVTRVALPCHTTRFKPPRHLVGAANGAAAASAEGYQLEAEDPE